MVETQVMLLWKPCPIVVWLAKISGVQIASALCEVVQSRAPVQIPCCAGVVLKV